MELPKFIIYKLGDLKIDFAVEYGRDLIDGHEIWNSRRSLIITLYKGETHLKWLDSEGNIIHKGIIETVFEFEKTLFLHCKKINILRLLKNQTFKKVSVDSFDSNLTVSESILYNCKIESEIIIDILFQSECCHQGRRLILSYQGKTTQYQWLLEEKATL
jgi:hypothetical protein